MPTPMLSRAAWLLLLAQAGCGAAASEGAHEFTGAPYATAETAQHLYEMAVRFNPEATPMRGVNAIELTVVDASGVARPLSVSLLPWMPAMNHGSSVQPSVVSAGEGRYLVEGVSMFMPGRWQLRVTLVDLATGDADAGTIDVDIP
jgi:hypothetical protein